MPEALAITRADYTAVELREAAARSNDADATRRCWRWPWCLKDISGAKPVSSAAWTDRRDWVLRYNAEGLAGLSDRVIPGPKPRLTPEQEAAVADLVRKGPEIAVDGVVRWRRVDLARLIKTQFNIILAERRIGAMPRRLGFRRLSVRPRHPQQDLAAQDLAAQETHKKTSPIWSKPQSPSMRAKSRLNFGGRMKPGLVSRAH